MNRILRLAYFPPSVKTVQKVFSLLFPEAGKAFRCIVELISDPEYSNDI
jgi:hypothetical protein